MNYVDLLKSDSEKQEDLVKDQEKQILEAQELVQRNNWLAIETSKKFIKQLEDKLLELNLKLLHVSLSSEVDTNLFRLLAVEVQTVSKTLNLLKHGRYIDSADLAASTNFSTSK